MQKWYSVMPPSAREWWESLLQTLETTGNHAPADNTNCLIFSLKNNVQRPTAEPVETAEIPAQLSALQEKELEPLEEVNKNKFKGGGILIHLGSMN
jgi:hypothetical protein